MAGSDVSDDENGNEPTDEVAPVGSPTVEAPYAGGAGEPTGWLAAVELPEPPPASIAGSAGRSRRPLVAALAVLVAAAVLGAWFAASRDDEVAPGTDGGRSEEPAASFWGHRWQVVSIREGDSARTLASVGGQPVVLDASTEGQLSYNGCNGGGGTGRLDGDRLLVTELVSTEMACTDAEGEALMAQDAWLASFLMAGPNVAIDAEKLTLTTDGATVELTDLGHGEPKEPVDPGSADDPVSNDPDAPTLPDPGRGSSLPPGSGSDGYPAPVGGGAGGSPGSSGVDGILGQRWTITRIGPGTGSGGSGSSPGVTARPDGSAPMLDTRTEGQVGFTGCNGGRGGASLDGDRLLVDGIAGTKMACSGRDGEALMAQDATLAAILEAGPTVAIEGDTLALAADAGTIEATRVQS